LITLIRLCVGYSVWEVPRFARDDTSRKRRAYNAGSFQAFKFIARDFAEAHTLAGAQKCGWIFLGIEQAQWCATDEIPAAGGT
jgi:hypothetical protein